MLEVGRHCSPFDRILRHGKSLKTYMKPGFGPRLAKGRPPNPVALLAFFEKLGKFRPEAAEYY
jgi:hypothetical protein